MERGGRDPDARRTTAEQAGEAVGGVSGLTAGAALGSLGGPLGMMIGAVAGAVGGWWAVHAATAAHTRLTPEQEAAFRSRHARRVSTAAPAVPYERASTAYQFGFIAGCNPRYGDGGFAAAERELRHGWTADVEATLGSWEHNRDLVHEGFASAREMPDGSAHGKSIAAPGLSPLHADPATEVANRVHDRVAHRRDVSEDEPRRG